MAKNLPNGKVRLYMLKLGQGGRKVYIRCKEGTAKLLGLEKVTALEYKKTAKGVSIKKGSRGTKSYILRLKSPTSVGGATVNSVSLPVDASVRLNEFYSWAQKQDKISGIVTPYGVSYDWGDGSNGGGGSLLPKLPGGGYSPPGWKIPDLPSGLSDLPWGELAEIGIGLLL